jgi:hypothetical protein
MLSDFEIIDLCFAGGLPSDQAFSAWQRIKDKLTAEALKPSHNSAMVQCPKHIEGSRCSVGLHPWCCCDNPCTIRRARHQ